MPWGSSGPLGAYPHSSARRLTELQRTTFRTMNRNHFWKYPQQEADEDDFPPPPIEPHATTEAQQRDIREALERYEKRAAYCKTYYAANREKLRAKARQRAAKLRASRPLYWCVLPKATTPPKTRLPEEALNTPNHI